MADIAEQLKESQEPTTWRSPSDASHMARLVSGVAQLWSHYRRDILLLFPNFDEVVVWAKY
jgi:hypothetical protein